MLTNSALASCLVYVPYASLLRSLQTCLAMSLLYLSTVFSLLRAILHTHVLRQSKLFPQQTQRRSRKWPRPALAGQKLSFSGAYQSDARSYRSAFLAYRFYMLHTKAWAEYQEIVSWKSEGCLFFSMNVFYMK